MANRMYVGPNRHASLPEPDGFYRWLMRNTIGKIRNKERMGYRGAKKRYSVFRAEQNQKWASSEEETLKKACEKHGIDVSQFLSEEDNQNRRWREALNRFRYWEKENLGKWQGNTLEKR